MGTKLTDPNTGSTVSVDDDRVDTLVKSYGYTKAGASKSTAKPSSKSSDK